MRHVLPILLLVIISLNLTAQRLSKVTFSGDGAVEAISLALDEDVQLDLSTDGSILQWGVDLYKGRTDNFRGKLYEYNGRVEYYPTTADSAFRGKVKSIGRTVITYYASYEHDAFKGKVKTIGSLQLKYNDQFTDEALKGKLAAIGSQAVGFYTSFDNTAFKGKLKNIGNTQVAYYNAIEDVAFRGKIKSIGNMNYTYYSSYDRPELKGRFKSGTFLTTINGVQFHIKN